jgi:hypothetical protein
MSSRILVVTALSAGLAAFPMLASADTGGTPADASPAAATQLAQAGTTGTTGMGQGTSTGTTTMDHRMNSSGSMGQSTGATPSGSMGSGSMGSGSMGSGSMGSGDFNPHNYRTTTDCLNAAAAAHVSFSACGNGRGR